MTAWAISVKTMKQKPKRQEEVKKYSYSRIAGNYLRLFSKPGRFLLLIIIIAFILIISLIFLKAVLG